MLRILPILMRHALRKTRLRLVSERMLLAPKAQYSPPAWGIASGFKSHRTPALIARVISSTVETRFQRFTRGHLNSRGNAPGWHEKAPLALIKHE
jgi:hypothetical protein